MAASKTGEGGVLIAVERKLLQSLLNIAVLKSMTLSLWTSGGIFGQAAQICVLRTSCAHTDKVTSTGLIVTCNTEYL